MADVCQSADFAFTHIQGHNQQQFRSFAEARVAIRRWIEWYNTARPHQALGYRSPYSYAQLHAGGPPDPATQRVRAA